MMELSPKKTNKKKSTNHFLFHFISSFTRDSPLKMKSWFVTLAVESPLLKFVMDVERILLLERKKLVMRAKRTTKSVSFVMIASNLLALNSS